MLAQQTTGESPDISRNGKSTLKLKDIQGYSKSLIKSGVEK